ncbi:hypothetical protein GQ457_13G028480 [Hibiscus cannabinus]
MEESNNYGHQHPLLLLKEDQPISHQIGVVDRCSRCREKVSLSVYFSSIAEDLVEVVSAPCFGCAEDCGFYLHKVCAEAPLELNHPYHRDHPLVMKDLSYYESRLCYCKFCDKRCDQLIYHCSCGLDFHIKCALFTFNIAQNNFKELEHVALVQPSISTNNDDDQDFSECFGCLEPLANYAYFSPDCGFNLHKKCAELPLKMNHKCHRKHPLVLQFNGERFLCSICQTEERRGFVYGCSPCGLYIHIKCLSQPRYIEDKSHQHSFTLFWRQVPFTCDACGTQGDHVAYTCGSCDIMVHKKCISLPRFIKSKWHDHRLSHTYFRHREDSGVLDCIICHEEVNAEYGSYSCSKCNDIFHVSCATKDEDLYVIVDEDDEPLDISVNSLIVLEWNDAGEAILVQHFKHIHSLTLSDQVSKHDNRCCDGCLLPISVSFYYCPQCEFYLHKICAELPKVKHVWHHGCRQPLVLTSNEVFRCVKCRCLSNSFAYECEECIDYTCLRCVIALTPGVRTCLRHKHPLLFYKDYTGQCSACGGNDIKGMFRCKDCNISLDHMCFSLPIIAQHKCDEHLLSLTDHDDSSYSKTHFCDICEESRDPNLWFYHCARCNTSAHINCVLGDYPFVKLDSIFEIETHEHPLTFVKRIYNYPNCNDCVEPCLDYAFECPKSGCNYITHIECPGNNSSSSDTDDESAYISYALLSKLRISF